MTVSTMTDVQALAFELWALKCNRRMKRVQIELSQLGHTVELAELNRWAKQGQWAASVKSTFEQIMPDVDARTWSTMALAGEEAADYLRSVVNGQFRPEVDPADADEEDPYNDPAFARIRVEAAKQVLLMTGWSPSGGFTKEKPKDPYNLGTQKKPEELTTEELLALEAEIVEQISAKKQEQEVQNRKKRRSG